MINTQNLLATIFGVAMTFMVPAMVWITLAAGLFQLAHEAIHRLSVSLRGSRRLAHRSAR